MKDIKFRRVFKNKKTKEILFAKISIPANGAIAPIHLSTLEIPSETESLELIGQDLYLFDDSNGIPVYENDIIESYSKRKEWEDEQDEKYKHKEEVCISPNLQSSNDWTYNIYGWALKDVDINKDYYVCRKIISKYEEPTKNERD